MSRVGGVQVHASNVAASVCDRPIKRLGKRCAWHPNKAQKARSRMRAREATAARLEAKP